MRVIREGPHDFLVARHLEHMGLLAQMSVTEVIAEKRIPVRQALAAGHQSQGVAGQFVFRDLPHDLQFFVEFLHPMTVAAIDQQVTVGEQHGFMDVAWNGNAAETRAGSIQFFDTVFALPANEVMAVLGLAHAAKLIVEVNRSRRRGERDGLGDFACAVDLGDSRGAAFHDQDVSVGQGLTSVDLGVGGSLVLPRDLVIAGHFERTAFVAEKEISVGENPAVLRMVAAMLPFDFAVGGDECDAIAVAIRAKKSMPALSGSLSEREQRRAEQSS